jgi:lipoate-protein ligase A
LPNWFLLYDQQKRPAAENMAIDEFLFNLCQDKKLGFFRIYCWDRPSFSMGVSQKISKAINVDYIIKNKYSYVRRITGGKTVLHNDEITYSVVSSEDIFFKENDLYQSYMLISRVLVSALLALGIDANLFNGNTSHLSKSNYPCFSFSTPHEIEIKGKKIIASAQKRNDKALLQHGSIPLTMDYQLYAKGANSDEDLIKRSMTTLSDVSNITKDDLVQSLIKSFQVFINGDLEEFELDKNHKQTISEIEKKYDSKDWNYNL